MISMNRKHELLQLKIEDAVGFGNHCKKYKYGVNTKHLFIAGVV